MESLIVLPNVTSGGSWGNRYNNNFTLVDTRNFTFDWCIRHIPGCQFDNLQIWASNDPVATSYAIGRTFGIQKGTGGILVTKSVWEAFEKSVQEEGNFEKERLDEMKVYFNIVEDLKL